MYSFVPLTRSMKRSRGSSECRIADLPEEILIDILSRLSIKTIVTCRCVSKTWHNLVSSSNPQFTRLHFRRSPVQFILQTGLYRIIYFHVLELEGETDLNNTIKPFPSRFRLSKCNLKAVNSCNGFLLLATVQYHLNPVKVCNPITGEYLNLPNSDCFHPGSRFIVSGFGVSAKTNQYKVVRLVYRSEHNPVTEDWMVEVYTIGTKSWRTIGIAPKFSDRLRSTTFFNGAIHWVHNCGRSSDYLISFDLESEKFGIVPPPPRFSSECVKIGVLGEFLYVIYIRELWVMKEYGIQESWTKMHDLPRYPDKAIKYLSDGKIIMNSSWQNELISHDPVGKISKEFKFPQFGYFNTFSHVPSFMSFSDAMMGSKAAKLRTRMCRAQVKGRD